MRTLMVLGASARAAAFSIRRAGYQPYAIDVFADRDLTAICPAVKIRRYPYNFLASLAAAPEVPWMYTGGLENYPRLVDRLADVRPLLGNPGGVLRKIRDPRLLAEAARDAGCSFPPLGSTAGLPSSAHRKWLVKPRRSSGGQAIRFADVEDIERPPHGTYLQQHIEGESASAVFVAASGRAALLGMTRQLVGRDFGHRRPFLYVGSIGPLGLHEAEAAKLNLLGNLLAQRFGLMGLFNIDFVRTADEIWPVEVNPRYSASVEVLERITASNFVALHVDACERNALPVVASPATYPCSGKATVYAQENGRTTGEFEELVNQWNLPGPPPGLADVPRVGDRFIAGQPVVTVLCDGSSMEEVESELRRRLAAVDSTLHG